MPARCAAPSTLGSCLLWVTTLVQIIYKVMVASADKAADRIIRPAKGRLSQSSCQPPSHPYDATCVGLDAEVRLVFGDYQCLMQRVVDNLKQAVPFAAKATQTSMLNKYIER